MRVKKWKADDFKGNAIQRDKKRKEELANVDDHDYIVLTDTE